MTLLGLQEWITTKTMGKMNTTPKQKILMKTAAPRRKIPTLIQTQRTKTTIKVRLIVSCIKIKETTKAQECKSEVQSKQRTIPNQRKSQMMASLKPHNQR